jgi:uncharacterized protein
MTPQERELILGVAQRLRGTPLTEKDNEAERLIQTDIGSQPDALYRLTQAVIVQEQGLRHAQERIHQLEADLQAAQQSRPSGFLSSLFGGGLAASSAGSSAPPLTPYAPSSAPGGSAAGSFLRSAAATAAGVVGGQLIYDGLRHMFGGASFAPGMGPGSFAIPPVVTNVTEQSRRGRSTDAEGDEDVAEDFFSPQSAPSGLTTGPNPGEDRSSLSGGGAWEQEDSPTDDSLDNDDYVAGGGDFETNNEDSGDYDGGDTF